MLRQSTIHFNPATCVYDGAGDWARLIYILAPEIACNTLAQAIKCKQQFPERLQQQVEVQVDKIIDSLNHLADPRYPYKNKYCMLIQLMNSIDELNRLTTKIRDDHLNKDLSLLAGLHQDAHTALLHWNHDIARVAPTAEEKRQKAQLQAERDARYQTFTPRPHQRNLLQKPWDCFVSLVEKVFSCLCVDISEDEVPALVSEPAVINSRTIRSSGSCSTTSCFRQMPKAKAKRVVFNPAVRLIPDHKEPQVAIRPSTFAYPMGEQVAEKDASRSSALSTRTI